MPHTVAEKAPEQAPAREQAFVREAPRRRRPAAEPATIIPEPEFSYVRHRAYSTLAFAVSDAAALAMALLTAGGLRFWLLGEALIPQWSWALIPAWWVGAALMRLLPGWGLGPIEELRRHTLLLCVAFGGLAVALFLSKQAQDISRLTVTLAFALSLVTVPYLRLLTKRLLIVAGLWGVPTAIYGAGEAGAEIIRLLREEKGLGYDPIVVYDDNPEHWDSHIEGVPVLGSAELVMPYAPVSILAMPSAERERQIELMEGPLLHYRTVVVLPNMFGAPSLWVRSRDLGGMLGLEIKRNLSSPQSRFTKRALDVGLVTLTLPLWVPLCALVAALIWLEDRTSPFFLQERVGKGEGSFKTIKFRTMVPNAEEVLRRKLDEDSALRREWESTFKLKTDPRVTRIGRVLRRLSLDELPQLVNVLRGEMSLVGPRPLPDYHYDELPSQVRGLRRHVRPGLTGLWQTTGRSESGTEGMNKWDPYYVRNWSLWLDAVIIARTFRAVLTGSGAY